MDIFVNKLRNYFGGRFSLARSTAVAPARFRKRDIGLAASVFMASCQGTITTDLATEVPADPNIRQVVAPFLGVEFRRDDGGTERIELRRAEAIDLMAFTFGDPVRLLTDEDLPEGNYNGVRLIFVTNDTDNAYVVEGVSRRRTLTIEDGAYASMGFRVEEDESSSEALTLMLDLRLSLSANGNNEYTLAPVLRSVRTDEAGEIQGTVTAACLSRGASTSPAVYLFEGKDITPDDYDGQQAEPVATAPVLLNGTQFAYALRFIPKGDYTIAFSCDAQNENPRTDDSIEFQIRRNVALRKGETLQQDLTR